jgi:hypothetical protein
LRASHQEGRCATRPRWAAKASRVKEPVRAAGEVRVEDMSLIVLLIVIFLVLSFRAFF